MKLNTRLNLLDFWTQVMTLNSPMNMWIVEQQCAVKTTPVHSKIGILSF